MCVRACVRAYMCVRACACVCVRACARARARVRECVCARMCVHVCVHACVRVRARVRARMCVCVRACARARFACLQPHRFRAVTLLVEILASAFSLPCITSVLRLSSVQPTRPTLVAGSVNWLVASLKAPRNRNAI